MGAATGSFVALMAKEMQGFFAVFGWACIAGNLFGGTMRCLDTAIVFSHRSVTDSA
jgi:hypothetical protein